MKKTITLIFLLSAHFCFSQKNQVSFHANSGFFSFWGASPEGTSFVNAGSANGYNYCYTNNPYGTSGGFSYGLDVRFQRVTRRNFIYGVQAGFESLSSKTTIDAVSFQGVTLDVNEGKTILTNNYINLFPSIGQRLKLFQPLESDLIVGFDLGLGLSSTEHIDATTVQGEEFSATNDRDIPGVDFRTRIELVNYYKSFGLSIGYSRGLTNYQPEMAGANKESKTRYFRLGLCYRLK